MNAMENRKASRRELLIAGVPALAGAALASHPKPLTAAESPSTAKQSSEHENFGAFWPKRRKQIERAWLDLLGEFPQDIPPLDPVMKEVAKEDGITRYHVSFQAEPGDRVTAWLLVPDSAKHKPAPAIICVHSTTWGAGKNSTAGLSGRRLIDPPTGPESGRGNGLLLAQHGYVTLCIDLLTDGERIKPGQRVMDTRDFYLRHPEWSMVGKNTWDIMRSVDFLQTLEFVDGKQIGCTGWSLGGHTSIFAAAFEPRITATVSNGGVLDWHRHSEAWSRKPASWTPWKQGDPETSSPELERRFGFKTNSGPYTYIKKFRPYIEDQSKPLPVDFDGLMMMVAPRPLLIISSEWEFYGHKSLPKCLEALKVYLNWQDAEGLPSVVRARQERLGYDKTLEYYGFSYNIPPERLPGQLKQIGAGDCFSWFSFPGGHSYPPVAQHFSFAWFDRWLGHAPPA
jgi:dienelactone hydrolase